MINLYSILFESKQQIVNLGYPEVIAAAISEKFGKIDYLIAKWFRDSVAYQFTDRQTGEITLPDNWWRQANQEISATNNLDLVKLVEIYNAVSISEEKYNSVMKELGLYVDEETPFDQMERLEFMDSEIKEKLFKKTFFSYDTLINDVINGKITDLKPYKDLTYQEAKDKYDKKRIFKDAPALKTYPNGWKWINVGGKCQLVGAKMKNCGSAGLMSMDPDKTILTLFDKQNKPHVMVTYSPNEKRLSGEEGAASSAVKTQYHDYVIDLEKILDAKFDYTRIKSKSLKIKSALQGELKAIENVEGVSSLGETFKITMNDGSIYYTDSYSFVSNEDVLKLSKEFGENLIETLKEIFGRNSSKNDSRINQISLYDFIEGER